MKHMRVLLFLLGVVLLIVPEFLRVYYIMPFPGSQEDVATDLRQVNIAYWLHTNIWWVRLIGLALLIGPFIHYMKHGNLWKRIGILSPTAFAVLVFYMFNFKFMADKMFYPPKVKAMRATSASDKASKSLVLVLDRSDDRRAYPIELIGYHHQVLDTVDGDAVLITYCTVCRTGRAWKPIVDGKPETFRLVGMDHFNAMFEDSRTGSWWRQVNGECIAGPLKGQRLEEVPSRQITLGEFASEYRPGLVFRPDPNFNERYAELEGFDDGTIESSLEYRDSASWHPKSWVVGVVHNGLERAYDWNYLSRNKLINDTLGGQQIKLSTDSASGGFDGVVAFTASWERRDGAGIDCTYVEKRIPAYQEFWHSWRTFHPNTTRYEPKH